MIALLQAPAAPRGSAGGPAVPGGHSSDDICASGSALTSACLLLRDFPAPIPRAALACENWKGESSELPPGEAGQAAGLRVSAGPRHRSHKKGKIKAFLWALLR